MARPNANRHATPKAGVGRAGTTMSSNSTHGRTDARTDSIVPDGFNLEAAKKQRSSTPDDEIARCPRCESASIRHRPGGVAARDTETLYRCKHCDFRFDEPQVDADE